VAHWARDNHVWILSDEIYRWICFSEGGRPAAGLLDLAPEDVGPYVLIDGVSKSFAMTGWRIGYTISNAELAGKVTAVQSQTTSNPATPSQIAALAAMTETEKARTAVTEMVAAFRRRKDLVITRVKEKLPHLGFVEPEGAFYVLLKVDSEYGERYKDSTDWCSKVLEETGVACVPGSAFGDDRFVRISYATSDEILEEAIRRLAARK
jgi:aspartate aminotransferase